MAVRFVIPLLGVVALLAPAVVSARRCPGGRFAIETTRAGIDDPPVLDAMVIELRGVTLGPCGATRLDARRAGRGMVLRASWQACTALGGRVVLSARIDRTCSQITGVLRVRGGGLRFRATRTPFCGNGVREGDEACDEASACCAPGCTPAQDPACAPAACATDQDCAGGAYCAHPTACSGPGACRARPEACLAVLDPACGCDGRTYGNTCEAARAGVDVLQDGRCGKVCGTRARLGCPDGSFCEFPPDTCGVADRGGTCTPIPDACTAQLDLVCGCDGRRYGNDCERQRATIPRARCSCDPPGCPDLPCFTDRDCLPSELCLTPVGACGGDGLCASRPVACLLYLDPVCGCDGRTYGNWCGALNLGVNLRASGPCP